MVKRTYSKNHQEEPDQAAFEKPSEREHLFQVTDVISMNDEMGVKLGLDDNTVCAKLEVMGGEEEGRTLLQRLSLDEDWKGFFATRLFLKAIGEEYKGAGLELDSDRWLGRQVYATVVHNTSKGKTYANISEYNFDKKIEQQYVAPVGAGAKTKAEGDINWEE